MREQRDVHQIIASGRHEDGKAATIWMQVLNRGGRGVRSLELSR